MPAVKPENCNYKIVVSEPASFADQDSYFSVFLEDDEGFVCGSLQTTRHSDKIYYVESVDAINGYGPLLYDVAIEVATRHGAYLMSGSNVSIEAARVWKFYAENRSDVIRQNFSDSLATQEVIKRKKNWGDLNLPGKNPLIFGYQRDGLSIQVLEHLNKIIFV